MILLLLFILGLVLGSFLNVLTLRYDPEKKFSFRAVQGRSHCRSCHVQLKWYELIPLVSFLVQKRTCRSCHVKLSWQYPLVELGMGVIAVGIYLLFLEVFLFLPSVWIFGLVVAFWILVSMVLAFAFIVDARHFIIPNGTNLLLGIMGGGWTAFLIYAGFEADLAKGSFLLHFAPLIEPWNSILLNHITGALVAGLFFLLIVLMTRGRGMGVGDIKLIAALGLLFGWPDILLIVVCSFILGTILVFPLLILRRKKGSDQIPFGPFIILATFLILFWGAGLLGVYFDIIQGIGSF
ncbi:MAG: prepilin peptidase [Candidatus Paceibacterota bacterium]